MKVFALPVLFVASLAAPVAWAAAPPDVDASLPAAATKLIRDYAAAEKPVDLTMLYRLQLAAGRYAGAEATLDRLGAVYRSGEPRLVPALAPWRIYARAKAYEAAGTAAPDALARAFAEQVGS